MKLSSVFERAMIGAAIDLCPNKLNGRPRILSDEDATSSIFKVLRTGMQWNELSSNVNYTTVFRRFRRWVDCGVFEAAYAATLKTYKKLHKVQYYAVDSSYVRSKRHKGFTGRNHTDRGRQALKLSVIVDQLGMVHGACTHPGNRPDVTLLRDTLCSAMCSLDSVELFADRGYPSRKNSGVCSEFGLKDRIFRRKTKTCRRTNAKRVIVEHTFAWLQQYRRLLHVFERHSSSFLAFVLLAAGNRMGLFCG